MPFTVKVIFSLVVLAAAVAAYFFLDRLEQPISAYLALFFGAFSITSFWIFPEVMHRSR